MIKVVRSGEYRVFGVGVDKTLNLGGEAFLWRAASRPELGEVLLPVRFPPPSEELLAAGWYRLYVVEDEPGLATGVHLELCVGEGIWQGYLLKRGLPTRRGGRIIPTHEVVSRSRVGLER